MRRSASPSGLDEELVATDSIARGGRRPAVISGGWRTPPHPLEWRPFFLALEMAGPRSKEAARRQLSPPAPLLYSAPFEQQRRQGQAAMETEKGKGAEQGGQESLTNLLHAWRDGSGTAFASVIDQVYD